MPTPTPTPRFSILDRLSSGSSGRCHWTPEAAKVQEALEIISEENVRQMKKGSQKQGSTEAPVKKMTRMSSHYEVRGFVQVALQLN